MMIINNETVGISAEVAICREFGVKINSDYSKRANESIIEYIQPCVRKAFVSNNIPLPIEHIAEGQNPVDFRLNGGKTLSVKSNQTKLGKIAPQKLGQPTEKTYFDIIKYELNYNVNYELKKRGLQDNYANRAYLFKELSINRIKEIINIYWKYTFECDYLIYFYNIFSDGRLLDAPKFGVFGKTVAPNWKADKFSFTQTLESWNESCTLKYNGYSIGEFQVHRNRNCFKFRFNMDSITLLMDNNLI